MRFQALTTISTLLHLTLCASPAEALETTTSHALAAPLASSEATPAPTKLTGPYFMVTGFQAFIPWPAHAELHSYSMFNLTLMDQDIAQQWTTMCKVHTADALCNSTVWLPCEPVKGDANVNETLSFRFGEDLDSVDIKRSWTYQGPGSQPMMYMNTMASEGTYWDESANGNVTVSQYGKFYQRPAGWVFAWKQMWG